MQVILFGEIPKKNDEVREIVKKSGSQTVVFLDRSLLNRESYFTRRPEPKKAKRDEGGNVAAVISGSFYIDRSAPSATFTQVTIGPDVR